MEEFKNAVIAKKVVSAIMEGLPISDTWGFPNFLLESDAMLESFFGSKVYSIYIKLDEGLQKEAISWFEGSGKEINSMVHNPSWEGDEDQFSIDCVYFSNSNPEMYKAVVSKLVHEAYGQLPEDTQKIIYDKFSSEPEVFQDEIDRNK